MNYLTYSYLLTPLHTGSSNQAGNVLGIAREAQTELPYIPSSSLRGKIRSQLEAQDYDQAGELFGKKLGGIDNQQPTEGDVWFSDATLLLFPITSYSHQFLWITCPLWLSRWNRWLKNPQLQTFIQETKTQLDQKSAVTSVSGNEIYLQGALLKQGDISKIDKTNQVWDCFKNIPDGNGILDLKNKLLVLSDDDTGTLVEIGLQREVRITLKEDSKIVADGSFRAEEAVPSETVMFFPWGFKSKKSNPIKEQLTTLLQDRIQFGGLEGLGRGWTENKTIQITK